MKKYLTEAIFLFYNSILLDEKVFREFEIPFINSVVFGLRYVIHNKGEIFESIDRMHQLKKLNNSSEYTSEYFTEIVNDILKEKINPLLLLVINELYVSSETIKDLDDIYIYGFTLFYSLFKYLAKSVLLFEQVKNDNEKLKRYEDILGIDYVNELKNGKNLPIHNHILKTILTLVTKLFNDDRYKKMSKTFILSEDMIENVRILAIKELLKKQKLNYKLSEFNVYTSLTNLLISEEYSIAEFILLYDTKYFKELYYTHYKDIDGFIRKLINIVKRELTENVYNRKGDLELRIKTIYNFLLTGEYYLSFELPMMIATYILYNYMLFLYSFLSHLYNIYSDKKLRNFDIIDKIGYEIFMNTIYYMDFNDNYIDNVIREYINIKTEEEFTNYVTNKKLDIVSIINKILDRYKEELNVECDKNMVFKMVMENPYLDNVYRGHYMISKYFNKLTNYVENKESFTIEDIYKLLSEDDEILSLLNILNISIYVNGFINVVYTTNIYGYLYELTKTSKLFFNPS